MIMGNIQIVNYFSNCVVHYTIDHQRRDTIWMSKEKENVELEETL